MDKDKIKKIGLANDMIFHPDGGLVVIDGHAGNFANAIESAVAHDYEEKRKKDVLALVALRSEVALLASENLRLRTNASNAIDCLEDKGD